MANPTRYQMPEKSIQDMKEVEKQTAAANRIFNQRLGDLETKIGDTRVVLNFGTHNLGDKTSLDDPAAADALEAFARDYYSGDPARRKPHLDRMFDELERAEKVYDFDYTDPHQIMERAGELVRFTQQGVYMENVISDNPGYLEERYKDPARREQVLMANELSRSISHLGTVVFARAGYSFSRSSPLEYQQELTSDTNLLQAISASRCSQQKYQAALAIQKGEAPPPLRLIDEKFPSGSILQAAQMFQSIKGEPPKKLLEKMDQDFLVFEQFMVQTPAEKVFCQEANIKMMDKIFIDGKSVTELFGAKYAAQDEKLREFSMRVEVMAALGAGRQRVEIATVLPDENNNAKVTLHPMKMDITKTQPTLKQEYGPVRRLFNWGPFKLHTQQEKRDALYEKDPGKEERQKAILEKLQPKVEGKSLSGAKPQEKVLTSFKELSPEKKQPTVTQRAKTAEKTLEKVAQGPGRD